MAIRYYLVPVIGNGFTAKTGWRPKYFIDLTAVKYRTLFYGWLPTALIQADVDQATHDTIVANSDVVSLPENLSQTINLTVVQNIFTSRDIPASWLNAGLTYLQVLRRLEALFNFATKYQSFLAHKMLRAIWANDVTLAGLPGFLQADLQEAADFFGVDTAGVTGSTTVEELMVNFAAQIEANQ